jgi:hypothetical protein
MRLNAPPPGVVADECLRPDDSQHDVQHDAPPGGRDDRDGQDRAGDDSRGREARAVVLRCRDDGMIARWIGAPVRGQLTPLPPALLALAAVAMLGHLGLRDLPGILMLAPALVMLLAAPGSSHPHDGRLDWLVPAVLQGAQYIYITALGSASGVPAGVSFLLCAVIAVRYADLGARGSPVLLTKTGGERGGWLGWDGRMIACGLGGALGVAMFAYLALAAYLAVLVCGKMTTGYAVSREGDSR